jgi:hypothetical protein
VDHLSLATTIRWLANSPPHADLGTDEAMR